MRLNVFCFLCFFFISNSSAAAGDLNSIEADQSDTTQVQEADTSSEAPVDRSKQVLAAYQAYTEALETEDAVQIEATAKTAYDTANEIWGDSRKETGLIALNYGNALRDLGKTEAALAAYKRCEGVLIKFSESEHFNLVISQSEQINIYRVAKNNDAVTATSLRLIESGELYATDNKEMAAYVGESYLLLMILSIPPDDKKYKDQAALIQAYSISTEYAEKAEQYLTIAYGENHIQVALAQGINGYYYEAKKDWETAAALYKAAYEKLLAIYGPDHEATYKFKGRYQLAKVQAERPSRRELKAANFTKAGDCKIEETEAHGDVTLCIVKRKQPYFPLQALSKGGRGFVLVNYTITETGDVTNINIMDSWPGGVFNKAALKAVKRWKFKPPLDATGNVVSIAHGVRFVFYKP